MNKLEQIKKRLQSYRADDVESTTSKYRENQRILRELVEVHGKECVAEAAEITVNTLRQYTTLKSAPPIKTETVNQAVEVLKGL